MSKNKKRRFGLESLINWGATIVIIGLMFKILSFKGGEWMIGVGLAVEAVLFFIMGFVHAEEAPDWTRVFPELNTDYEGELPKASPKFSAAAETPSAQNAAALDKMLQDAEVTPELVDRLGQGLRAFGDKVEAISKVSDTAAVTNEFADKLNQASSGVSQLSSAFERTAADLKTFNESSTDMQHFKEQINTFNKNLTSLNAVYGNMLSAMNENRS